MTTRYFVMTGGRDADEVMDRAGAHGSPVRAVAHLAPSGAVYGAVEIFGDEGAGVLVRPGQVPAPAPGELRGASAVDLCESWVSGEISDAEFDWALERGP